MKTRVIVGFFLFLSLPYLSNCQNAVSGAKSSDNLRFCFIENKGQIIDQNSIRNPATLFLLNTPGMNVQLRQTGFSYDLYSVDDSKGKTEKAKFCSHTSRVTGSEPDTSQSVYKFHRIDINLEGTNPDCIIIPSDSLPDYLNFYNAYTPVAGITNVRQFHTVIYKNIYHNIDIEFYTNAKQGFKYNVVVHPGGKISDLKLNIKGPDQIHWSPDTLKYQTSAGDVYELIPESYVQMYDSKINIKTNFIKLKDGIYGFSLDQEIPENSTLVIDPTSVRIWGTYYGGGGYEYGIGVSVDPAHNVFITGYTESTNNIATAGAYQTTKRGHFDNGYLVKFNANGVRQWGTYYGGDSTGTVLISGCANDISGNIYLAGFTTADSGIATPGAHQSIYGGGLWDAFLAKFNTDGQRLWATYYGGEDDDEMSHGYGGVSTDKYGNVYICGASTSTTNISTPGAYQESLYPLSGQDAFLVKFDSNGIRQWGTYYGGNYFDAFGSCVCDTVGNLFVTGTTASTVNIASPGAFQTTFGGYEDAFLVAFTVSGQRLWGTYFGGNDDDETTMCTADHDGSVYFAGSTKSANGIASTGCHQPALGGGMDGFIAKFNNLGERKWSSYYGGNLDDLGYGCSASNNGDVFLTGFSASLNGIATPNSFMPVFGGGYDDGFLVKFNSTGQRQWGTYFGGTQDDLAAGCTYLPDDTIYFTGHSRSLNNIATPDAHQPVFCGGMYDAILEKFIECWPIDVAGPIAGPLNVCINTTGVNYSIPSLAHAVNYIWKLPTGVTLTSGGGTNSITANFGTSASSGNIRVKGLNKCGDPGDSAFVFVTVHQRPVPVISGNDTTCTGPGKVYSTSPGNTNYQWSISSGGVKTDGGGTTDNTITVNWLSPGLQTVQVNYTDANGCTAVAPAQFNVFVIQSPAVSISINASANNICAGDPVNFAAVPANGGNNPQYQWKVNGVIAGINFPTFGYTPLNGDLVSCTLTSNDTCSSNNPATSNTITLIVNPILTVSLNIASSVNPCCAGNSVTFSATPVNGGASPGYQWKINGAIVGTNSLTYSYMPANGDQVKCILTSGEVCTTNNPATSNQILMAVDNYFPVDVSIVASSNPFCPGGSVIFIATQTNGGTSPQYQWKVNGTNVGTNSPDYTYNPANGDLVKCILNSNLNCTTNNPATSNTLPMIINNSIPAGVSITCSPNPFCSGANVLYTATPVNGGMTPVYQWKLNGINSGTNSSNFSYSPQPGDSIRCEMTSNLACISGNPALSNKIVMVAFASPVVTFTNCFDSITILTANPIRLKGGIPIGGTYSGPGVNSSTGVFIPSAAGTGLKTIIYTYTNVYSCSANKSKTILVQADPAYICGNNLTDIRDNKLYPTVEIGSQCWMAKNLDFGFEISDLFPQTDNCIAEKYIRYSTFVNQYSIFYQWDELMQYQTSEGSQGLCPPGWHVPTENDWTILFNYYQGNSVAGKPLQDSNINGFKALRSGVFYLNSSWNFIGFATLFWSSTSLSLFKSLSYGMNTYNYSVSFYPSSRANAFPVRCLRN